MVHCRRGEVADSAVPVVEVVPVEKGPSKGPGILDAPEPIRELRAVLHSPELTLGERVVRRGIGPTVALRYAEIIRWATMGATYPIAALADNATMRYVAPLQI